VRSTMKLFNLSLLLTIVFALGTAAAHAEVVGRVLMAAGDTSVIRDSRELRVAVGFPVEGKDTLRTGSASNMQVRFTDESIVSMRDQSLLKIDEYQFTGKQDGAEKAFFNLLKGGFRTITGLIGRVNKTNYGVKTATATIGIRGTNFALLHCTAGSCGAAAKDGLYGGVSGGIIAATNNTGEYQFGSGDYFYVPSEDAPAQKLIGPPGFLADHLTGQGHVEGQQAAFAGNERSQNSGAASDSRPNSVTPPPPQQSFVVTENKNPNGGPDVIPNIALPNIAATILPTSGTAVQFPFVSGTVELPSGPTALSSASFLIVNFVLRQIGGLNPSNTLTFSTGTVNYTMNSLLATYASPSNISGTLSGSCSGGACSTAPGASGTVNGQFTGTTGAGLVITLNAPAITSAAPAVALTAVKYSCPTC
jgi:hypothetical protein